MPGKGVLLRPDPTSSEQWQRCDSAVDALPQCKIYLLNRQNPLAGSYLGQSAYPMGVVDNHLERNDIRLFGGGKAIVLAMVWLLKSGCNGNDVRDWRYDFPESERC